MAEPPGHENEEFWHDSLTRGDPRERQTRRFFKRIPQGPRCTICAAPFGGVGAPLMRLIGKRPSEQSPKLCTSCFSFLASHHGGAEIELSILFADIRGSTAIAERTSPAEFHGLLDRFYRTA
jgi:adenylate cyclase